MWCLYQLKTQAPVGAFVIIGGPYDTYGQVLSHQASGFHLIRGLGHAKPTISGTFWSTESER